MQIERYEMGPIGTNCYILTNDDKCLIVDPSGRFERFESLLENKKPLAILLTHGHFDHIKAVDALVKHYDIPVYLNERDLEIATSIEMDQTNYRNFGFSARISVPTKNIDEGEMTIEDFKFKIYATPGHTEGSLCFQFDKDLFVGDLIFKQSIGRTDLYGGNMSQMKRSLQFLKTLDNDLRLYPGHGEETTLAEELKYNPFLKGIY